MGERRRSRRIRTLVAIALVAGVLPATAIVATPAGALVLPTLVSKASAGGQIGAPITGTVTLSSGVNPTGTITFELFGPAEPATCATTPTLMGVVPVNGNGTYTSPPVTSTAAGLYVWRATYSGDLNNASVVTDCASEFNWVGITKIHPTIETTIQPDVPAGTPITLTATLSETIDPHGAFLFELWEPPGTLCAFGHPDRTWTTPVNGNGVYSMPAPYVPIAQGHYVWAATYLPAPGDPFNQQGGGGCLGSRMEFDVTPPLTQLVAKPILLNLSPLQLTVGFVSARLTALGGPVAGQTVSFSAGGLPLCSGVTDANGNASCAPGLARWLRLLLGTRLDTAFAGTPSYLPSSDSAGLIE